MIGRRWHHITLALALLVAFASESRGQSQQPPPSAGKVIAQPQAQPGHASEKPAADERGTQQSPIIVKILPAPETQEQTATEAKREEEKTTNDRRLATFTELLFWATSALAVIAGLQLFVFGWQGIQLKRAVKETQSATKTAQAEFIATHRPQIRVRNIVVDQPRAADGRAFPLFSGGHTIGGQFFVVNAGGSRADILDGHCTVYWTQQGQLPMRRPYEGKNDNLQAADRTLLSGQSTFAQFRSENVLPSDVRIGGNEIGAYNLYVMGWVTYSDRNNDVRRTSFCRQFRRIGGSEGRFYAVDDPDYEHEE